MKKLLICFGAGCLGALANSLVVWQAGALGLAGWAGVGLAPALTPDWLYPRIVWGGIWGLAFVLPFLKVRWLIKGSLLSLLPTAVQLFFVYPYQTRHGIMGVGLGMWTPAFVLVANWVWGVVTAVMIRFAK